jgi:cytochrome c oxidase cbb3-type subunit 3
VEQARQIITSGGPHETMPVWGNVLTEDQLTALVDYTFSTSQGTSLEVGQSLFTQNCASCHGEFGEGGPNPTRQGDIIAPISTAEFLKTRDDFTLRSIISQGQPNFGMSPFGTAFGGPLETNEIDAIVAYLRAWQAKPPVELPPEIAVEALSLSAEKIYADVCAQCHGAAGEGGIGPSFQDAKLQAERTDQQLFDSINLGHQATSMIAWGDILSADQIQSLVSYIRQLGENAPAQSGPPSFKTDLLPILTPKCIPCHGSMGGWDASSYATFMSSGDNAPVVIAGDADNSLLIHKLQGTQSEGGLMPPGGKLPDSEIQLFIDWINAGAPDN